jgi:hypothetical protein
MHEHTIMQSMLLTGACSVGASLCVPAISAQWPAVEALAGAGAAMAAWLLNIPSGASNSARSVSSLARCLSGMLDT